MTEDHNNQVFIDELRAALLGAVATDTIAAPSSPDTLLDMIVRAAARAIPCPEGALLLIDHSRRVLTFDVVIGKTASTVKDLTVPIGQGIAGLVAASGQALAVSNAQDDPRHARDVAEKSGYLPTTILAVPVIGADGAPVGVLELLDRQGQPSFSLADMELLGMFADQVAVVLELRRSEDMPGSRIGMVLSSLSGIPDDVRERLRADADDLARRLDADPAAKGAAELAELVASISTRGEAERVLCMQVLGAVAGYLDAKPSLGMEMFR